MARGYRFILSFIGALSFGLSGCGDDDPETSCLEVGSVDVTRESWRYSSRPRTESLSPLPETPLVDTDRMSILWFSHVDVFNCADLFPATRDIERDHDVEALGILLVPDGAGGEAWAGLTTSLDSDGNAVDLSDRLFIDLWLNDFNRLEGSTAELRLDLGTVSEDAVWDPLTPPAPANGSLDLEDRDGDGVRAGDEDTGLDQKADVMETPGSAGNAEGPCPVASSGDPAGDDYAFDDGAEGRRFCRFRHINGTEGNQRLDTEDLNGNQVLDTRDDYFEFRIPLGDGSFTETDVHDEFPQTDPDNGWRRLRIPLDDPSRRTVGSPDLNHSRQLRLWFAGITDTTEIAIGSIRFVTPENPGTPSIRTR